MSLLVVKRPVPAQSSSFLVPVELHGSRASYGSGSRELQRAGLLCLTPWVTPEYYTAPCCCSQLYRGWSWPPHAPQPLTVSCTRMFWVAKRNLWAHEASTTNTWQRLDTPNQWASKSSHHTWPLSLNEANLIILVCNIVIKNI